MPKVTKDWAIGLDGKHIDRVLALGAYNHRAILLFIETDEGFRAYFTPNRTEQSKGDIFHSFFMPYFTMWASMVYVVHEGLTELGIEDRQLERLREAVDMKLLRRFRNATFHYQPFYWTAKHADLVHTTGFRLVRQLYERQDFVVRKMIRLITLNPLTKNLKLEIR